MIGKITMSAALLLLLTALSGQAAQDAAEEPAGRLDYSYDHLIVEAAKRNRLDPNLVRAVIWRESRFDYRAKGLKGEIGLMQIMPGSAYAAADWARAHRRRIPSVRALQDPKLNIEIGCWYLGRALRRYRHYKEAAILALCEFKDGARTTANWLPDNRYAAVAPGITNRGTRQYIREIMQRYYYYRYLERKKLKKGKTE